MYTVAYRNLTTVIYSIKAGVIFKSFVSSSEDIISVIVLDYFPVMLIIGSVKGVVYGINPTTGQLIA
jgi:hypothetical protein